MKMGVREYLFLWSWTLKDGWSFPTALETAEYDPRSDRVTAQFGFIRMPLKVTREGSESCDILKKHGLTGTDRRSREEVLGGMTVTKPKAEKKKAKSKIEWQDACVRMHTALRKCCDSKITSAAYNLIHLMTDTSEWSEWSAWRMLGELVAKSLNEGKEPVFALSAAIFHLDNVFRTKLTAARQKDKKEPGNARTWMYALQCTLQCFSDEDVTGMASYLEDE